MPKFGIFRPEGGNNQCVANSEMKQINVWYVCISAEYFGCYQQRRKGWSLKALILWTKGWGSLVDQMVWHLSLDGGRSKPMILWEGTKKSASGSLSPSQGNKVNVYWVRLFTWPVARMALAESFSRSGSDIKKERSWDPHSLFTSQRLTGR